MIVRDVTIQAPEERSFYTLRFIPGNHNSCTYSNEDGVVTLHFERCSKKPASSKQILSALQAHEDFQTMYCEMADPIVDRYIIEDGQIILHVQQEGRPELSMLVQAAHASWSEKNWEE